MTPTRHQYQVSREHGARFTASRREAAETACEWAKTFPGEIAVWQPWWIDRTTGKSVSVIVFPGDKPSRVEGYIAAMDAKHNPKPPDGPKGGQPVPIPQLRAA